jgi:hypothetical protein
MTGHSRHTANAFASTFYFFADTQINAKKIKRACKPTHGGQFKLATTDLRPKRTTTANKGFAIAWVPCFADTFVQGGSSVLRIKFSAKTPRHRKPPKR